MAKQKSKKTIIGETEEKILEMGQENEEKAAEAVIEVHKEAEKEKEKEKNVILEKLTEKRKRPKFFSYKEELAIHCANMIHEEQPPKSHGWFVEITDKGILASCWPLDSMKKKYKAFSVCGDPIYDFRAMEILANWVLDEIYGDKKKSGIILPN